MASRGDDQQSKRYNEWYFWHLKIKQHNSRIERKPLNARIDATFKN